MFAPHEQVVRKICDLVSKAKGMSTQGFSGVNRTNNDDLVTRIQQVEQGQRSAEFDWRLRAIENNTGPSRIDEIVDRMDRIER